MSALILVAAALSTLLLSIVLSGMLILAIKDFAAAFSDKPALPLSNVYHGNVRRIHAVVTVA